MKIEDYLLFMFSMKGVGKRVDFNHIKEKVGRDLGEKNDERIKNAINLLIKKGFLEEKNGLIGITKEGKNFFDSYYKKIEDEIEKVNKAWLIVYKAKNYYPKVAKTVVEFCKNRYVGFYALFTEKRFFRRDFRGKKIIINNERDLMFFVNMHYIDVIPCVHTINSERPDWLVIDIDPGEKVDFEKTKQIAEITYEIFKKLGLNPAIKFSGSRGFQIWSWIKEFEFPKEYEPLKLRAERKREKNYFTLFSDFVRIIQFKVNEEIPNLTTSDVALPKEKRKNLVLLDPSSMKKLGLVRAPYGIHSKTGLISMPISIKELADFKLSDAKIENVLERYEKKGNEFLLKESDPKKLIDNLLHRQNLRF